MVIWKIKKIKKKSINSPFSSDTVKYCNKNEDREWTLFKNPDKPSVMGSASHSQRLSNQSDFVLRALHNHLRRVIFQMYFQELEFCRASGRQSNNSLQKWRNLINIKTAPKKFSDGQWRNACYSPAVTDTIIVSVWNRAMVETLRECWSTHYILQCRNLSDDWAKCSEKRWDRKETFPSSKFREGINDKIVPALSYRQKLLKQCLINQRIWRCPECGQCMEEH